MASDGHNGDGDDAHGDHDSAIGVGGGQGHGTDIGVGGDSAFQHWDSHGDSCNVWQLDHGSC
eukprot:13717029-Alexandrium_andersonii.AAC.1